LPERDDAAGTAEPTGERFINLSDGQLDRLAWTKLNDSGPARE
jgi:hypothetical protein